MRFLLQPLYLRTIFSISSSAPSCSLPISISHFSTSQTQPLHVHPFPRRHEELSRRVKVSVWWDFENCAPPADYDASKIPNTISAALRANGVMGPFQITAFGDALQLPRAKQKALTSTGVRVSHVPKDGKNSADRTILADLMNWTSQNPPPAHVLLISSDRDFASILHGLRMKNYNILLACDESKTPSVLCSAATIIWNWETLLKDEELTGKYCNQPPDGTYDSWYGPYMVSRHEILVDCRKLVKEILKDHPQGYDMSNFRNLFQERYGYPLDITKLGYKKLASLLLGIMPGVKMVGTCISPASTASDQDIPNIRKNTSHA